MTSIYSSSHSESSNTQRYFPKMRAVLSAAAKKFFSFRFTSMPGRHRQVNQAIATDVRRKAVYNLKPLFDRGFRYLALAERCSLTSDSDFSESKSQSKGSDVDFPESETVMLAQSTSGQNQDSRTTLHRSHESTFYATHLNSDTIELEEELHSVEDEPEILLPINSADMWRNCILAIEGLLQRRKELGQEKSEGDGDGAISRKITLANTLMANRLKSMYALFRGAVAEHVWDPLNEFSEEHGLDQGEVLLQFMTVLTSKDTDLGKAAPTYKIDNEVLKKLLSLTDLIETQACKHNKAYGVNPNNETKRRLENITAAFEEFIKSYDLGSQDDVNRLEFAQMQMTDEEFLKMHGDDAMC